MFGVIFQQRLIVTTNYSKFEKRLPRDMPLARKLLAEAGYPDGFEVQLHAGQVRHIPLHRQVIPWAMRSHVTAVHRADSWLEWRWVAVTHSGPDGRGRKKDQLGLACARNSACKSFKKSNPRAVAFTRAKSRSIRPLRCASSSPF